MFAEQKNPEKSEKMAKFAGIVASVYEKRLNIGC